MTVTQKRAYWVLPPSVKEVPYAPLSHINFQGKAGSLAALRSPLSAPSSTSSSSASPTHKSIEPPSSETMDRLYSSLSACSTKPAILSIVKDYSSSYVPKSLALGLPQMLTDLFKPEHLNSNFADLLQVAADTEIVVSSRQCEAVEVATRSQANSRVWFRMRTGRITASRLKAVCSTDPAMPSLSLIMSVCHPKLSQFQTAATIWGCEHESKAREKYKSLYSPLHEQFLMTECGFFIHPDHSFMGASPDGLVNCLCCGEGICEIKVSQTAFMHAP